MNYVNPKCVFYLFLERISRLCDYRNFNQIMKRDGGYANIFVQREVRGYVSTALYV